jgi:hypothetical protein
MYPSNTNCAGEHKTMPRKYPRQIGGNGPDTYSHTHVAMENLAGVPNKTQHARFEGGGEKFYRGQCGPLNNHRKCKAGESCWCNGWCQPDRDDNMIPYCTTGVMSTAIRAQYDGPERPLRCGPQHGDKSNDYKCGKGEYCSCAWWCGATSEYKGIGCKGCGRGQACRAMYDGL